MRKEQSKDLDNRYAVIGMPRRDDTGKEESVDVLLDTPISLPVQKRDARVTFRLIVDTLSAKTGVKVYLGTTGISSDPLYELELTVGGESVPARTLLLQALDGVRRYGIHFNGTLVWNFDFDADMDAYCRRLDKPLKY